MFSIPTGTLGAAVETIPYTYGDSNWKDKLTAYNGTAITYDAIGNPLNDGMWTYEWQAGRQLKKMTREGQTLTFKYDHNGMRIQKVLEHDWYPETTKYTYHGKLLTHMTVDYHDWDEVTQQDKLHFFYDAQSRPAKVVYNGVIYTYVQNLQGDIVGMLDSAGTLVVEYKYDAWGKLLGVTGSLADKLGVRNPFRYRGYVYDGESELYYLRSRYFTPVVGRFVNADTQMGWTSLMGKNMYLYCLNSPSLLSDRDGFSPVIEPRPSRPDNWDADYRAEFCRERMQALARKAAKAVMQAVRNVNLYRMVLQLANHGGGVIKFKSGLKATCYTSAYWYKINRPSADWNRRLIDGVSMAGGAVLNGYKEQLPRLGALGSYIGWIGAGLFLIDISNDMQYTQINRCIDSAGSIGWIGWEKPAYSAVMPTAWNSKMFTPTEWFGEIDSVEFFD